MKILVLCMYGKNRSRYLAKYLAEKGYETDFSGVLNEDGDAVQNKINNADIVVTVSADVNEMLKSDFISVGKKIVEINIDDRPGTVANVCSPLSGDDWISFQEKFVYPKLITEIDKFLPF